MCPIEGTDFEAEHDIRVLTEADEIRKNPSRITRAKSFAQRQQERMKEVSKRLEGETQRQRFSGSPRESSFKKK